MGGFYCRFYRMHFGGARIFRAVACFFHERVHDRFPRSFSKFFFHEHNRWPVPTNLINFFFKFSHNLRKTNMDLDFSQEKRPKVTLPKHFLNDMLHEVNQWHLMAQFAELDYGLGDEETMIMFKMRLTALLVKMMYVSGETAEPFSETTGMVEEIVRQQVIEMVRNFAI